MSQCTQQQAIVKLNQVNYISSLPLIFSFLIRIHIQNTDPYPEHCLEGNLILPTVKTIKLIIISILQISGREKTTLKMLTIYSTKIYSDPHPSKIIRIDPILLMVLCQEIFFSSVKYL